MRCLPPASAAPSLTRRLPALSSPAVSRTVSARFHGDDRLFRSGERSADSAQGALEVRPLDVDQSQVALGPAKVALLNDPYECGLARRRHAPDAFDVVDDPLADRADEPDPVGRRETVRV